MVDTGVLMPAPPSGRWQRVSGRDEQPAVHAACARVAATSCWRWAGDRIPETRSPGPWWHAARMVVTAHVGRLLGRQRERAVLERLLGSARDGHGAVLVVHGE